MRTRGRGPFGGAQLVAWATIQASLGGVGRLRDPAAVADGCPEEAKCEDHDADEDGK